MEDFSANDVLEVSDCQVLKYPWNFTKLSRQFSSSERVATNSEQFWVGPCLDRRIEPELRTGSQRLFRLRWAMSIYANNISNIFT